MFSVIFSFTSSYMFTVVNSRYTYCNEHCTGNDMHSSIKGKKNLNLLQVGHNKF